MIFRMILYISLSIKLADNKIQIYKNNESKLWLSSILRQLIKETLNARLIYTKGSKDEYA